MARSPSATVMLLSTQVSSRRSCAAISTCGNGGVRPIYANVDEFFRNFLRPVYRRPINARTTFWAADWWRHPEAVLRLDAMWRSWEQARLDPATGMATWLRDIAGYHMSVLMSAQGPFGNVARRAPRLTRACHDGTPATGTLGTGRGQRLSPGAPCTQVGWVILGRCALGRGISPVGFGCRPIVSC